MRAAAELFSAIYKSGIPHHKIPDQKINTIKTKDKLFTILSLMVLTRIRSAVKQLGVDILGFSELDAGTCSNRSGRAMGMYLGGTPI